MELIYTIEVAFKEIVQYIYVNEPEKFSLSKSPDLV